MAETFTSQQKIALSKLRVLLNDISDETYKDPSVLMKFLTARDLNEKQAESMIRKNIRWKKEIQADTLLSDFKPPEVMEKYLSVTFIGFDKEGYVVRYIPVGNVDGKGLTNSVNGVDFRKYLITKALEDVQMHESQTKKWGKPLAKSINIYNVENLSFAQITHVQSVQHLMKFLMIIQDNFPEIVRKVYVINASAYFTTIWPVIKKCLSPALMNKFCIYGHDGWKEELLKIIDADILPAFLGGEKRDPDGNPLCLTTVNPSIGPVPRKYFLEKNIEKIARTLGVKSAKIDRQGRISEAIEITELNSIIHWEFELKSYDIGFGISLEKTDGIPEDLIPVHRIETELKPYIGMYRCKKLGKHFMVFDNSYSWLHMKEIYYRIWITNGGEK